MTDIVLKDADPILFDRIRRVADARGWDLPHALQDLLEQGLHVYEGDGSVRFDNTEADALAAMIKALEQVPDGQVPQFMALYSDYDELPALWRPFESLWFAAAAAIVVPMVVASVLMSMGMMMLPPVVISLPFKLIFFVLVDGWHLVAGSLVRSFVSG